MYLLVDPSNEDDITVKLTDIVAQNSFLRVQLAKGAGISQVAELWSALSESVAIYINSETPGLPPTVSYFREMFRREEIPLILTHGSRIRENR